MSNPIPPARIPAPGDHKHSFLTLDQDYKQVNSPGYNSINRPMAVLSALIVAIVYI